MRLHHRMRMVGRGVGRIEPDRRRGERAVEIAGCAVGPAPFRFLRGALGAGEIEGALGGDIVDADQLGCGARLLEALGDHDRDRLVMRPVANDPPYHLRQVPGRRGRRARSACRRGLECASLRCSMLT